MAAGRVGRAATFALVLVLTVQLCVWGAFLVPLRAGGTPVPLGLLLALATVPLCRAGAAALGRRAGAGAVMAVWAVVAVLLASQRREGDLVITGGGLGVAYLLLGLLGAAVTVGTWSPRADEPDAPRAPARGPGANLRT